MKVNLGGDRIGSGAKMPIDLQEFGKSNHDLGFTFRSTMAKGTLVPFLCTIGLPNSTHDIELNAKVLTPPTLNPLLGSDKLQLDVYTIPLRLYNSWVHNNKANIGNHMEDVKLPTYSLPTAGHNIKQYGISSSSIFAYLGNRQKGSTTDAAIIENRNFNAAALIGYWDIGKNYYANKQEEVGYMIHTEVALHLLKTTVAADITVGVTALPVGGLTPALAMTPATSYTVTVKLHNANAPIEFYPIEEVIQQIQVLAEVGGSGPTAFYIYNGTPVVEDPTFTGKSWSYNGGLTMSKAGTIITVTFKILTNTTFANTLDGQLLLNWTDPNPEPTLNQFQLSEIDSIREGILATGGNVNYNLNTVGENITNMLFTDAGGGEDQLYQTSYAQEGLLVKTYQSDIFNNWLNKEWLDSSGGVNEVTKIDVSGGFLYMNDLIISNKIFKMLNNIAAAGGTINNWQQANYNTELFGATTIPMYEGGLSKEIVYDEVESNSSSSFDGKNQPLGTLAARGVLNNKHKGGKITIKCHELCIIMGIVSITPRLDYSLGNEFYIHLETWNDFHKASLDRIGFQDLILERAAGWSTTWDGTDWITYAGGKQPAWIDYQTSYNKTFGEFAVGESLESFVQNREYEFSPNPLDGYVWDWTTYIDPKKWNGIFAVTSRSAQNMWVQIRIDHMARQVMSAKIMPNL